MYMYKFMCLVQNLVETKSVLGSQELLTNAYGLIAVSAYITSTCYTHMTIHTHNYAHTHN